MFVRPCWYRAYVDNRPDGIVVDSPDHLEVLCADLAGQFERAGCPELAAADARRECEAGARSMEEALVTFS